MVIVDKQDVVSAEEQRLREDRDRTKYWKKWGPYTAERQWATVREDYSLVTLLSNSCPEIPFADQNQQRRRQCLGRLHPRHGSQPRLPLG